MIADIFELIGREIELPGLDLGALRDAVVEVLVRIQIFVGIRAGVLDAVNAAFRVVEGFENQRGSELAFVDQVGGLLVVRIDSDIQSGNYLLSHAGVEIVVALHGRIAIAKRSRRAGRAREFLDTADGDEFGRRRREVTGIGRVERGALEELVDRAHTRTRLVRARQAVVEVEAHAIVDRQLLDRLPFVLRVDAVDPGLERLVVDDRDRDRRGSPGGRDRSGTSPRDCRSPRARSRSSRQGEKYATRMPCKSYRSGRRCPNRCGTLSKRRRCRSGRRRNPGRTRPSNSG